MSQISTHILDSSLGRPASGVPVALEHQVEGTWIPLAVAATDADGRVSDLGDDQLAPGRYRITFETASYYASTGQIGFFPEVVLVFIVVGTEHYHVPLLLSPFAYSTYRGS